MEKSEKSTATPRKMCAKSKTDEKSEKKKQREHRAEHHAERRRKSKSSVLYETGAAFLLAAACVVLEILCLTFFRNGKIARHFSLIASLCSGVTVTAFAAAAAAAFYKKNVAYRSIVSFFVLLLFMLTVVLIMQKTGLFYVIRSEELFRDYMRRAGALMPLLYIFFQFLQVVILPVPAFVSTAAGVALFGPFKAALCSFVGIVSGSLVAFFIGRKIGYKAVAWMVGKDDLDKWLKKVKGKDNFLLTAMFVLPLFPDDILCFVSGLSSMTWQYFVVMITLARSVGIAATCYSVNFIPFNTWWGVLIWCALIALIAVSFVAMYKNLDALNDFFKRRFRVFRKTRRAKNAAQTSTQNSMQTSARGGAQNKAEKKSA